MPSRPVRVTCKNEQEKINTLPEGRRYFQKQQADATHLFLGLGPRPGQTADFIPKGEPVFFLECPDMRGQMNADWEAEIPADFQSIQPDEVSAILGRNPTIWTYEPGLRAFPTFWSHIRALVASRDFTPKPARTAVLSVARHSLLTTELCNAFIQTKIEPYLFSHTPTPAEILSLLKTKTPLFWLSINFRGLDPPGENIALLKACGVPVLSWCVDNPFHQLSSHKSALWKDCLTLVTDKWFVPRLRREGAKAYFLPLATDPNIFSPVPALPEKNGIFFVGSSSFPGKNKFFACCSLPPESEQQALELMQAGKRPDLEWWLKKEGEPKKWFAPAWRQRGFGAESMSLAWRQYILRGLCQQEKTHIYGDNDWEQLVPKAVLHAGVDYYSALPALYSQAEFSLNLTSMQLPHGLTQRHFDVWAAGGFLLTDSTPGLELFPDDLTQPVCFSTLQQARQKIAFLREHPMLKQELQTAWQKEILSAHTYLHRVRDMLELICENK